MAKTIFKYSIRIADEQIISIPQLAKILHVADQKGFPQLWALVDPGQPLEDVVIQVRGTGHDCHDVDHNKHLGTFFQRNGDLVWHVFRK